MDMMLRHQNVMLALRHQMGWPLTKPANDCIAWTSGRPVDAEVGMELARVAGLLGKDVVYSSWNDKHATEPSAFTIGYRTMLACDVVTGVIPYAVDDDAPIILVNAKAGEIFAIDSRGSLVRAGGTPKALEAGYKRAMRRIKAVAALMRKDLLPDNRWMKWGSASIEPDTAPRTAAVRFV